MLPNTSPEQWICSCLRVSAAAEDRSATNSHVTDARVAAEEFTRRAVSGNVISDIGEYTSSTHSVSANRKVVVIGTSDGHQVRFVPDFVGIPDGAAGYGHFIGPPDPGPYDRFGDSICPTMELAGGGSAAARRHGTPKCHHPPGRCVGQGSLRGGLSVSDAVLVVPERGS